MDIKPGDILEGKVTKITNFGAFVEIGENSEGLVHISEIADSYIKDINEVLKVGEMVKVKVVPSPKEGKIALSIKQTKERPDPNFEQKINAFLRKSEERLADFKKNLEKKQGIKKRRKF